MAPQADINFENELWQTAVTLRGTVSPADYKRYVLPLLFLRYISLRYEQRHEQLELLLMEAGSDYLRRFLPKNLRWLAEILRKLLLRMTSLVVVVV